uniref:Adhesion G-protein coupled receptor G2 n=2 Tax=Cynoglossus semilaevis TaxID=244447 RepID=A0A3P8UGF1_CYNSE
MINNHTTTSNNYTTNYNLTTASTINATTTPHNYTAFVNYTTTSNNYTTASTNHTTVFNLTTPSSASVTTSSNYTTTNPLTSISSNHTTVTMSNVTVVPPSTLLYNQTANNTTTSVTTPSATTDSGGNATTAAAHASKTTTSNVANMTTTGGALLPPTDTTTVEDATTTTTTTTTNNPTTAAAGVFKLHVFEVTSGPVNYSLNLIILFIYFYAADPTSTSVAQTTNSEQSLEALADDLLEQTKDVSKLDAAQVARLVKQLEKLLEGPSVSESLGQKVVQVVSNLVEADPAALSGSANRLIQIVDTVGIKLSLSGDRGVLSAESLVLAVRAVDGTNFPTTSVNIFGTNSVQLRALGRSRSKRSDSALGSVVLPPGLTDGLSPQQQQQANRVQFTYFSSTAFFQDETLDNTTMVSPVLGSSVANLSISNLTENVLFTIQNLQPVPENFTASCVFWDFSVNGDRGGWSSEGCSVVNSTAEATTCSCNHLTSFAILLDFPREEMIDPRHAQILTFITYIGCGVSAIFLAFTLLTYLLFDKLMRDIPAKILVQLCFSLLFLNLVFLLDGWLALYPAVGLCISTAFFLHYFLLTSFTWTGLEAVHMYLSIVQVFTPYLSRYMLKFSLVGWGFPLIVVIVIIAVNKDNYGLVTYGKYTDGTTDDFCWLRNDIAFYVGVVAYFLLIFSVCVVVFIIVMVQLARIKRQNPHNQAANRGVLADARSITGLVVLLGLTWGFALFAWGPLYIPFVYLFTICNSFQGFLIFVFHCAVKENVRRQWRTHLCCGRLRLAENSDWSRTATQSNRHPSMNTTNTSAPFSTSRSSSVSDSTTSGFALVDSGIYDNTTTDVVLNEAHRRALNLEREN